MAANKSFISPESNLSIANLNVSSDNTTGGGDNKTKIDYNELRKAVIPDSGIKINATWGDFTPALVRAEVINITKLENVLANNWQPLTDSQRSILLNGSDEQIVIRSNNTLFITNVFWGLGLANRNAILENGTISEDPSMMPRFASTALYIFGNNEGPGHLSSIGLINLSEEQQGLVSHVANNTYRPCCSNPVAFPDCNHGMAALGLAELMASQNATEAEISHALLAANSYWFPQTYLEMAAYFQSKGVKWADVDPVVALSRNYSSYSGYKQMRSELESLPDVYLVGSSCG